MADQQSTEQHSKEQPIIIKKIKKGGHHGAHGGAWKVAYADFVTAMMAFFIVMWILASSDQVKQAVTAYFKDPGAFSFVNGKRTIPVDLHLQPESGKGKNEGDTEGKGKGKNEFVISFNQDMRDSVVQKLIDKAKEDSTQAAKRVERTAIEVQQFLKQLVAEKPELQKILNNIKIEITDEGLRIELIEKTDNVFFAVGSSKLTPQAIEILKVLGSEIGKLPNNVVLEGHTDSRKYSNDAGYTNWELSSDRANAARRALMQYGLWSGQITEVVGYADRRLSNPQNPFDVSNRRISILIKQMSVNQFLPKTENLSKQGTQNE
jgi:chemotaxis protein MotB